MDTIQFALDRMTRGVDRDGLEIRTRDGKRWCIGSREPRASIELRSPSTLWRILANPLLAFGETYVDGGWEPGRGGLLGVLEAGHRLQLKQRRRYSLWSRLNDATASRRHVAHHYDLDESLYRAFLDDDLHYSCAYFRDASVPLEQAQRDKCDYIARKLDLRPGARVLDVGCGFGGLAMYLAERHGAAVTGVTLSRRQFDVASRRIRERGLDHRVALALADYREVRGEFDAIVSVGMFEHVGARHYDEYFRCLWRLLKPQGTALVHTIGTTTEPGPVNPWITKYIFPGGELPSASQLTGAIERSRFVLADLEVWRRHYALTLAEWNRRFQAAWGGLSQRFDERFHRLWSFYLAGSEAGFRVGKLVVFQAQMVKDVSRLPLTRDYLYRNR